MRSDSHSLQRCTRPLQAPAFAQQPYSAARLAAPVLVAAAALRVRKRAARRHGGGRVCRAAEKDKVQPAGGAAVVEDEGPPWQEIATAVLWALLDIFKPPPKEATGPDAPGLKEIGKPVAQALAGIEVMELQSGTKTPAAQLLTAGESQSSSVFFLTHWGDFNSWEVAQQVRTAVRVGRMNGPSVSLVGIGSPESGRKFAEMLELPSSVKLYADPTGACHSALHFSRGALPQYAASLNPYFRVFLMLLGVGSPGTIVTVLGGYFGDGSKSAEAKAWIDESLRQGAIRGRWPTSVPRLPGDGKMLNLAEVGSGVWDEAFGKDGLRPFELATVRLQNMVGGIIAHWKELQPADDELLVQQGGALVTNAAGEAVYFYRDKGILTYVPMEEAIAAASK